MADLYIALALFICVVWVISRAVLMIVRIDAPDDIPSRHFDPITTHGADGYGQCFQGGNQSGEERLQQL